MRESAGSRTAQEREHTYCSSLRVAKTAQPDTRGVADATIFHMHSRGDAKGQRGGRGVRGSQGSQGPRGERGPAGPSTTRTTILAAVNGQFEEIQKQLDLQLTRTAQVQMELDKQHRELSEVHTQLGEVKAALKQLLTSA